MNEQELCEKIAERIEQAGIDWAKMILPESAKEVVINTSQSAADVARRFLNNR